ncbi:MAG: PAS domain-containing protein [Robiginitomaculum sp.]|nr:PAS domain-containing protein [Robiginitomaculum sp.]
MAQLHSIFRSQLEFDTQRYLFDYWQSKCGQAKLPSRQDISPSGFAKVLPMISLVDVHEKDGSRQYCYRLAGTGLRTHYQQEITGKTFQEINTLGICEQWNEVFDGIVLSKKPSSGLFQESSNPAGPAHFWLRLPLVNDFGQVNMVLCYDIFAPLSASSLQRRKLATIA